MVAERAVVEARVRLVLPVIVRDEIVVVARVEVPVTTDEPVVVALVMREELAKMLFVKVLRKRSDEEPRE